MANAFYDIQSQIERGGAAWLVQDGAGTINDIFPNESRAIKHFPCTMCEAVKAVEMLDCNGAYEIDFFVTVRCSASEDPGTTQYDLARRMFSDRVGKTIASLRKSDDGGGSLQYVAVAITTAGRALITSANPKIAAANQDMAEFIVDEWNFVGFGRRAPDGENNCWEKILMFKAIARSTNPTD